MAWSPRQARKITNVMEPYEPNEVLRLIDEQLTFHALYGNYMIADVLRALRAFERKHETALEYTVLVGQVLELSRRLTAHSKQRAEEVRTF